MAYKFTKLKVKNTVNTFGSYTFKKLSTYDSLDFIVFNSPESFTLSVNNNQKNWDGTLEYSINAIDWSVWNGTTMLSADEGILYMRGTGNTYITGSSDYSWILNGSNISINGNIESLLDYITVINGEHPTMANSCYSNMFSGCTSLVTAPELPATTLTNYCYNGMFSGCTNLLIAPELPATTLADYCYFCMFDGCTSLTAAPRLPVTTLAEDCYHGMLRGCTNLLIAPELPATTLTKSCYESMFYGCTSLVTAPELPATTLAEQCYRLMFDRCTSLTTPPRLPATTLAEACYHHMFDGCTSLTAIPELPATTLPEYCYYNMFDECTAIKLSQSQTEDYITAYRIPASGTGETATYALYEMFSNTGGTFTGTPTINTTYYTSNTVV